MDDFFRDVLGWGLELRRRYGIGPWGQLHLIEPAARHGGGIKVITVRLPTVGRGRRRMP